jgi:NAD(P)-dependent dehydrogenase (short-subunit alcohol dehydrogenase family)
VIHPELPGHLPDRAATLVEGKVALVTGAARGQGRAHAVRLAEEGADIIAVDVCSQLESVPYGLASEGDLAETAKRVEELDRRVLTRKADVRDLAALQSAVAEGVAELGHLDIVCVNAASSAPVPRGSSPRRHGRR